MRCQDFWSRRAMCCDGGWHQEPAGQGVPGSGIPRQLTGLGWQGWGTAGAPAAPALEPKVVCGSFILAASHGNGSCGMTRIALISVSGCWGYWESIFCFGNIMFGFPKQNFEGFLFHENLKFWLTPDPSFFLFFLKTQCNKNSDFQPALLMPWLEDYFSFFFFYM